jgi:hypothetical protein
MPFAAAKLAQAATATSSTRVAGECGAHGHAPGRHATKTVPSSEEAAEKL